MNLERTVSRLRFVALAFAVVQTAIEPGDSAARSWVTVGVLAIAAIGGAVLLRGGPELDRVRLVGSAGMALDAAICVAAMFNNLTDPTDVVWVIVFMPMIEAALRWSLAGGVISGIGFGLATGVWGAAVSATVGVPIDIAQLSMRASVVGIVGGFMGLLVARLVGEERALQQVLRLTRDLMITVDRDGTIVAANDAAGRILGHDAEEIIGRNLSELLADDRPAAPGSLPVGGPPQPLFGTGADVRGVLGATDLIERPFTRADGTVTWLELAVTADDEYGLTYVAARDVTERREHARQLQHQAFHDPLTGVANRGRLMHLLDEHLGRSGQTMALLFVDLDRFKAVNDTLGHAGGDELLRVVVGRLLGSVRARDVVARLAGDEFCVLIPNVAAAEEAMEVAGRIVASLGQPYEISGREVHVSASVGVALRQPHDTPDTILHHADQAMYRAKQDGRNRAMLHDPADQIGDGEAADRRSAVAGNPGPVKAARPLSGISPGH